MALELDGEVNDYLKTLLIEDKKKISREFGTSANCGTA